MQNDQSKKPGYLRQNTRRPEAPPCLDAEDKDFDPGPSPKLYMVSAQRVASKVTRYHFDSNPLDTVVGTKVRNRLSASGQ